jgi:hypothetical protein
MGATPDMDGAKSTKIDSIEASPTSRGRHPGPLPRHQVPIGAPSAQKYRVSIEGTLSMRCGDHPRDGERVLEHILCIASGVTRQTVKVVRAARTSWCRSFIGFLPTEAVVAPERHCKAGLCLPCAPLRARPCTSMNAASTHAFHVGARTKIQPATSVGIRGFG